MKVLQIAKTVEEAVNKGLKDLGLSRDEVDIVVLEEPKSGFLGLFGSKDAVVEISAKEDAIDEELDALSKIEQKIQIHEKKESSLEEKPEEKLEEKPKEKRSEKPQKVEQPREKRAEEVKEKRTEEVKEEVKETVKEKVKVKEEVPKKTSKVKEETKEVEKAEEVEEISEEGFSKIRQEANNFLMKLLFEMGLPSSIDYREDGQNIHFKIIPENSKDTGIIIGKRGETLDSIQYLVNLVTNRHSDTYIRVILDVNNYRQRREQSLRRLASKMARNAKRYNKTMRLEPMNPYERRIIHSHLHKDSEIETFSEGRDPHRRVVIRRK